MADTTHPDEPTDTACGEPRWLDETTLQRAVGVLQGAAVGDALGAPFEFKPAGRYAATFPTPVLGGTGEMTGGGSFGWAPGEFTDDTQMGLALADAILARGGYHADTVFAWFREWATTARDVGATTSRSLAHRDWRTVAHNPHGAGNGALMRSFPLALAFLHDDTTKVRDIVLHQAALTHHDPGAGWGAWIAVEMMRAAVLGFDALELLPNLVQQVPAAVRPKFAAMLHHSWSPEDTGDHHLGGNGHVWGCLAQAVWCLRTTTSFEEAVVAAVSLGDDADTVACVTGALAGARYGVQSIPSRWATYVHGSVKLPTGTVTYHGHDLAHLAQRLVRANVREMSAPEPAAGPREVAPGLYAADLLGAASAPTDWAVVSLCRTDTRFHQHPVRRQVFLLDNDADHNPGLATVVRDAVASVQAFLAEGRNVVVHCHGGRSRTGLVLKAWRMHTSGASEREAHDWLQAAWHRYTPWNDSFTEHLRSLEH